MLEGFTLILIRVNEVLKGKESRMMKYFQRKLNGTGHSLIKEVDYFQIVK